MEQPDRLTPPRLRPFPPLKMPLPAIAEVGPHTLLKSVDSSELSVNRLSVSFGYGLNNSADPAAKLLADALLKEGTNCLTGFEISELFDFNGAWFRSESQQYSTVFSLWSLTDRTVGLLPTFLDILTEPAFPQTEFEAIREKMAANAEIELRKVATRASIELYRHLYGEGHPKAAFLAPDRYREVTADDLRAEFSRMRRASACTIYLGGAVDAILPDVIGRFAARPLVTAADTSPTSITAKPEPGFYKVYVADTKQSAVHIAIPTIPRSHPDYVDLRIAVTALGGYFGSRLMANIREDKGYTYGIYASLCADRDCSYIDIHCQCDPSYVDDLLKETFREIERLATVPMDTDELDVVKSNYISGLASTLESPISVIEYYMSTDNCGIPDGYFENQIASINSITAERIRDVFAAHVSAGRAITVVAGR